MKNPVIIKSYKNGISVYLDEEMDFDQILEAAGEKFRESAKFFGDTKVAVSFEGRALTAREENLLVDAISQNSQLHVICVVGKDEGRQNRFNETIEAFERFFPKGEAGGRFYRGSLTNGQILETEGSIVIIGNVEAGCTVMATKDIIVLGGLYGSAFAGSDGLPDHFIAALEMTPAKLKIGDFKYKAKEKNRWFGKAKKGQAQIAVCRDGEIQMRALTNELLNELPY